MRCATYTYDANGNLVTQPPEGVLPGWAYGFSPENRLDQVRGLDAYELPDGEILQESRYDPSGNRWVAIRWADGGVGHITLRDATGQVASEYTERAGDVLPEIEKEYVHAAGRLLVVNSACGPRPDLAADDPATSGSTARFVKTDHVAPVRDYTILIQTDDGRSRTLTMPADLADEFGIDQSDLYPDVANWVYIEADAECGHTGYSNGVSYAYSSGELLLGESTTESVVLTDGVIFDDPGKPLPPPPPPVVLVAPAVNAQYVHTDHLGSTRLLTDEEGAEIGRFKYYPFGHEAESSGGADNRMKFTGHERDQEIGLDYMLARYYGAGLSRFLSTDPLESSSEDEAPQSWNRYTYVRSSPLTLVDPNGEEPTAWFERPKPLEPEAAARFSKAQNEIIRDGMKKVESVAQQSRTVATALAIGSATIAGVALWARAPQIAKPAADLAVKFCRIATASQVVATAANPSAKNVTGVLINQAAGAVSGAATGAIAQVPVDASTKKVLPIATGLAFEAAAAAAVEPSVREEEP